MENLQTLAPNKWVLFVVLTAAAVLASLLLRIVLRKYLRKLTAGTDTIVDDRILHIVAGPFQVVAFLVIFYFALQSLDIPARYDRWVNRLYFVVLLLIGATVVSRTAVFLVTHWLHVEKRFEKSPQLVGKVISVTIYLLALLMLMHHFSINITPLITALGIGGLAIGLALQGTLSNFFAGLHIVTDRPFTVGDYVEVKEWDIQGFIEDIGWRTTRLRTLPNAIVVVPNNKISESVLTNHYLPEHQMSAVIQCGVAYESDLEKVERVTVEVASTIQKTMPGAIRDFEPFVRFHTFADSNINFSIILRIERFEDRFPIIHAFIKALKARYDAEGIEIAWPIRKVYYAHGDGTLKD